MTVLTTFDFFRYRFADIKTATGTTFSFVDNNPLQDTITRAAGSFVADGFEAGMRVQVIGSVSNNTYYTIATVAAGTLTLIAANAVVAEAGVAATLYGTFADPDGRERFPVALVRANGFTGGITGIPQPAYNDSIITATCNSSFADAIAGTPDFDWYLSQRTDVVANQPMTITQTPDSGGNSFSGSVRLIVLPDDGVYGDDAISDVDRVRIFKYCHLYVRRRSDGAIQWIDIFRRMMGNY